MLSFFFFFKQKTAYERRISDWSSDVCSSDLLGVVAEEADLDIRRHDRQRIAAGALGRLAQRAELGGEVFRRPRAGRPPAIGVTAGDVEHARATGADPDARELACVRFGIEARVMEFEELEIGRAHV